MLPHYRTSGTVMPSTEKSIRCLTCSAFSLQRSVHKILLRFEKDLSTFAVPRGSSNNRRMAAMENAGNIARFSADDAKHIIAVGDDRWDVTISATARRYRPQQKKHIGHTENQYRPQPYRPKLYRPQRYRPQNIRRVYLASS